MPFETPASYAGATETITGNVAVIHFTRESGLLPERMVNVDGVWKYDYRMTLGLYDENPLGMFLIADQEADARNDISDRIEAGEFDSFTQAWDAITHAPPPCRMWPVEGMETPASHGTAESR